MASKIQAYSSVVVTDYSDVGNLSLYLTSNQPTTVIHDPNQNTYTPNWSTSNLIITPVIAYNGNSVSLNATGLSVTFQRQEGSGTPVALTTGEVLSGNKLTVSANKLANVTSKLLTYICEVTYTDPDTNVPLTAQSTLTYNLVSNASELKYASISGESAFLYDTNRNIVGSNYITLTAELTNVEVSQWQYKKADGTFSAFPTKNNTSISGTSLKVYASESDIWMNDKIATIKLVTNDSGAYDLHDIVKIYDGAAGTDTVSAVLSNENHLVPVSNNGSVKSWVGAETSITIYEGGEDVTSEWTISVTKGTGLSGTYDATTHVFTPSALTVDASYAEFSCTKQGYAGIIKRYTITKQYAGADGNDAVIYEIVPNVYALNLSESGTFNPTSVTFNAYKKTGAEMVKSDYSGRFIISESEDGTAFNTKYTSGSDESKKVYTPSSNNVKSIKAVLYKAGGTSVQLDEQTIVITKDGKTGENGQDGTNGVSVVLGNTAEVIPCNTSGNVAAAKDISIPFYGFDGITRTAITCTVGTLPTGMNIKSNTEGTASAGGLLVLSVAAGATLGNSATLSGDITLTFMCKGVIIEQKFTWTKSKQAENGENAVLFQLYSPDGGTIYNGTGSTTIETMMMSGSSTVTPSKYEWSQYQTGKGYVILTSQTSSSLVVTASMVSTNAWFKCTATYNGVQYSAYWTVNDQSDPVVSYTFATVSQFKNGQGCGAIYTRVYRNGTEIDPIKTLVFSDTAPTSATAGDYYYHLDKSKKTCVLKKYSGTAWIDETEVNVLNYEYYRINSKGVELDTIPYKTDRCFYIDPSVIDGQMQFRCRVYDGEPESAAAAYLVDEENNQLTDDGSDLVTTV